MGHLQGGLKVPLVAYGGGAGVRSVPVVHGYPGNLGTA